MDRIVAARVGSQRWFERYPRGVPIGVFLLTLAFTVLAVFAIERAELRRVQAQTQEVGTSVASALERRANAHAAYLRSGAVMLGTGATAVEQFRDFAVQSLVDENIRGSDGIGWALRVPREEVPALVARRREEGASNFAFRPNGSLAAQYVVPVTYLEPMSQRNLRALGFDMYSEPVRRAAMDRAATLKRPIASGPVVLAQEEPGAREPGFLIYMPIHDRQDRLTGFIYSVFNARSFLERALRSDHSEGLNVTLEDAGGERLVPIAEIGSAPPSSRSYSARLMIANRPYRVTVTAPDKGLLSTMSMLTLLFGLLVAALLTLVATLVGRKAAEDRAALHWFQEQASIRNSLTRELNHRVKNTLANVLSIIALTRRRASDVESFADSLTGRIRALSATHDLLTRSEWGTTLVRSVIDAELAPYTQDGDHLIELQGPEVELAPNDALSLGLAIHELATNAAKYGALSVPSGRLRVYWVMISADLVRIEWTERGGPSLKEERQRGFGTELIEKIVAHELGRPVDLRFEPEGVTCALTVPVRKPVAFQMRAPRRR